MLRVLLRTVCTPRLAMAPLAARALHTSWPVLEEPRPRIKVPRANKMPPRPKVNEDEIEEKFIKGGSGKGGQKINKTNSKVQLTHIPTGLVVTSQATRSREQNRKIAREILAQKIQDLQNPETSRTQLVILRKQAKKARAHRKAKKKYRSLEAERELEETQQEDTQQEEPERS